MCAVAKLDSNTASCRDRNGSYQFSYGLPLPLSKLAVIAQMEGRSCVYNKSSSIIINSYLPSRTLAWRASRGLDIGCLLSSVTSSVPTRICVPSDLFRQRWLRGPASLLVVTRYWAFSDSFGQNRCLNMIFSIH